MNKEVKQITLRIDAETYDSISILSGTRGETLTETLRFLLKKGLSKNFTEIFRSRAKTLKIGTKNSPLEGSFFLS